MILIKGALELKHEVSTRLRFKIKRMKFNQSAADDVLGYMDSVTGITAIKANPKSSSLIVRFDPLLTTRDNIITKLVSFPGFQKPKPVDLSCGHEHHDDGSVKYHLVQFAGLSAVTAAVFVKEVIIGTAVAQTLFSPLGMITALAAIPLFKTTLQSIKEKRFTLESFLGASIIAACAAGEAAAALEILWITSAGKLLQSWITEKSRRSIKEILDVTAKNTFLLIDGVEVEVPVEKVKKGDTVVLHTGEKISVDGEIIKGEAIIDESPINGRAEHILKKSGEKVFAGTFVRQGVVFVKAEEVGDKTYLSRIFKMVEDSMENKAPIEGVADKLAENLIKTGFAVTLGTYFITGSLWRAFTVMLVMACPCATILSASTAVSAAISAAAKRHILIKGGRYLEDAGKADVICFDKTGTLTTNEPVLTELVNVSHLSDNEIIQLVYSAEVHNFHPIALAIKKEAEKNSLEPIVHDVCDYVLGRGVKSIIQGKEIIVGSKKMMEKFNIKIAGVEETVEKFRKEGLTTIFVAEDGNLAAVMGFANEERPGIENIIAHLKQNGVKEAIMITGDEECTALNLASKLEIMKCYHSVMPEDKAAIVKSLKDEDNKVLMVGDGINDALALAEGDIGIAMGAGGSEVAIEAADIALVTDELDGIVYVHSLSKQTLKIVHENFWIATGSNILGVILGATGLLSPVAAGLIHITHTLGILLNSGRLLNFEPPELIEDKSFDDK